MAQETHQPMAKRGKRTILLALVLVLVVVGGVVGFLFYAPSNAQISIRDPPQQPYDSSIQAIYVTFTSIEIHSANAGDASGWHTLTTSATVNVVLDLSFKNSEILNNPTLNLNPVATAEVA